MIRKASDYKLEEFAKATRPKGQVDEAAIEAEERARHNARAKILSEAKNRQELANTISMCVGILLIALFIYFVGA